jgi:Outer membrane lipoprotein-sorting protein
MKRFLTVLLLFSFSNTLKSEESANQQARILFEEAIQRSDIYSAQDVRDFKLILETIESRKGREIKSTQVHLKALKTDRLSKVMVRYTEPAGIKGTTYLVYWNRQEQKPEDIWLYLPSFKNTKRISPYKAQKSLPDALTRFSFFNTDNMNVNDYSFSELENSENKDQNSVIIEIKPKKKSVYSLENSKEVWIEKSSGLLTKMITKNGGGEPLEQVEFNNYKLYSRYWLPTEIITADSKQETITRVSFKQIELNLALKASDFDLTAIENPF